MQYSPTISEIRAAVERGVATGNTSAGAIAAEVHCSVRTLHRRLRQYRTTFTAVRRQAQAARAFALLKEGAPVRRAADSAGLTPDHLRIVVREAFAMTPHEIREIALLARGLRREPTTNDELAAFRRMDHALQERLAPIGADHPMLDWARAIVLLGDRPEYDTPEFAAKLRASEAAGRRRRRDAADAARVERLPPDARELTRDDVLALLAHKQDVARTVRERNAIRLRARKRRAERTA